MRRMTRQHLGLHGRLLMDWCDKARLGAKYRPSRRVRRDEAAYNEEIVAQLEGGFGTT